MNIGEKFLPIGTVVLLKDGIKRVMINGYCAVSSDEKNTVYDYSGVLFPEGLLKDDHFLLFNHNQIVRIDHLGFSDEEQKKFVDKLKQINLNN